jgi:hypothetical protein
VPIVSSLRVKLIESKNFHVRNISVKKFLSKFNLNERKQEDTRQFHRGEMNYNLANETFQILSVNLRFMHIL